MILIKFKYKEFITFLMYYFRTVLIKFNSIFYNDIMISL